MKPKGRVAALSWYVRVMASPRWLALTLLATSSTILVAACSDTMKATTSTSSGTATSSSGTGGGGASTSVASGTGGAEPDAGPLTCKLHTYSTIKNGPCDLLAQDCPAGQTCKELAFGNGTWSTQCVVTNGLKGEGQVCNVDEECRAKLTCVGGRCTPVCCAATNAPCLGGLCNLTISLDPAGKVTKQVCLYSETCDLLTANACSNGNLCQIRDAQQGLATCFPPSGAVPDLGPCHFINECADMESCLGGTPTKAGSCHFYCYLDQADPASPPAGLGGCPVGQTCQTSPIAGAGFDFNLPNVGLCAPAP